MDICLDHIDRVVERQIAEQCAPVILGIKTANLLVLDERQSFYASQIFKNTELSLYLLCSNKFKTYSLLYQPYKLKQYIQESDISSYLSRLGYSSAESESVIKTIAYKYNNYMQGKQEFPHEIGLLLGYPLVDVFNFVLYHGTRYLYSGYWKVYDNLSEALLVFDKYHRARDILHEFLMHGGKLRTVMDDIIKYE